MTCNSMAPERQRRRTKGDDRVSLALVLGGGAACGLAHIGVLEVLEREGITVDSIAGTSMGGLIGAMTASGLRSNEITDIARGFRFPRWFLPGGLLDWNSLFGTAICELPATFEALKKRLLITAVDLEQGNQVVLYSGELLPAVQATCAVPGVLPAVEFDGRWLVDGAVLNVLPVDVAWMANPDIVLAVKTGALQTRAIPQLRWPLTGLLARLGGVVPNPATAKVSFEILVRASEIILERQAALTAAMTDAEILIEPDLGDVGMRDFGRMDEAIAAGRRAAEASLPAIAQALNGPFKRARPAERTIELRFDPVCAMVISPSRARATTVVEGTTYYFCSPNCRDCFERDPERYRKAAVVGSGSIIRRSQTAPTTGLRRNEQEEERLP